MAIRPVEPRRRRRKINRRALMEAASHLFREEGYRATSLERVASELGVTRAALYHWVPSKEALLCEIHEEAMELMLERFHQIDKSALPPAQKLAAALRNHLLVVAHNLDTIAVFFQDEASVPEGPARRIAARKRAYDHSLEALVRAGQGDGSIRPDLNSKVVVETLLGMCNWIYHWYDPDGRVKPDALADQVVEMALGAITATPAGSGLQGRPSPGRGSSPSPPD